MPSYYADKPFLNIAYAVDIQLFEHLSNLLFDGDQSRMVYASNAHAMRKRAQDAAGNISTSNLNLPFMNFRTDEYSIDSNSQRWNVRAYTQGAYVPELEQKVIYAPLTIEYEATFWCHRDDELRYAFNEIHFDSGNKTTLIPSVNVGGTDLPFTAWLTYDNLDFDPEYNEQDWLERNKIHSASIDFQIETFALKSNENITLTEEVVFNFAANQGYDAPSYEEALRFTVDHLTEEVTPV